MSDFLKILTIATLSLATGNNQELLFAAEAQSRELAEELQRHFFSQIADSFSKHGICCSEFDPNFGITCRGKIGVYPKDVVLFIPANYKAKDTIDLALHLHGDLIFRDPAISPKDATFDNAVLNGFDFGKMLRDSGRNGILVVPASETYNRTYLKEFSVKPKGKQLFQKFLGDLSNILKPLSTDPAPKDVIANITLTGHSRAYVTLNEILDNAQCADTEDCFQKKISQVAIIDGTYGTMPNLTRWANLSKKEHRKFSTVYRKGSDTELPSREIARVYCQTEARSEKPTECMTRLENNTDPNTSEPQFFKTDQIDHMGTVDRYLPILLREG